MVGLDQNSFRYALKKAGGRAAIIKKQKDQSDNTSREVVPDALKVEKEWTRWS